MRRYRITLLWELREEISSYICRTLLGEREREDTGRTMTAWGATDPSNCRRYVDSREG